MPNRTYTERELQLTLEWAAQTYPNAKVINRYRINRPPGFSVPGYTEDQIIALLKPTGYMIDAVVILPNMTLIVEAKTDNESQAVGQLLFYVYLLRKYADIQDFDCSNLVPVLLFAKVDRDLMGFAQVMGVSNTLYSPDWIQDFLKNGYSKAGQG